ncbi:MAG: 3-hydroxyacyl-CoA dehydrogenase family protein [Acidobacteriota bacterium]
MSAKTQVSKEARLESGQVAVIGAGTMGRGIAQVAALAGHGVSLWDLQSEQMERALDWIGRSLEKGVKRRKITESMARASMDRVAGCTDGARAVQAADLVVEAVPEKLEIKQEVLDWISRAVPCSALIATNTSSIPLRAMVQHVEDPSRFVGLHFFNPPHRMPLVEIVVGERTSEDSVDRARRWVSEFGKEAIVVRDTPGFATSRLGLVMGLEAMRMLEEGVARVADIDRAMELGYRHPMGPLKLTDLVGLDVRLGISEILARELDPVRFAPPAILKSKVEAGRLGKKTGEGFYLWTEQGPVDPDA